MQVVMMIMRSNDCITSYVDSTQANQLVSNFTEILQLTTILQYPLSIVHGDIHVHGSMNV